ncbi:MAG TPA: YidB family protein [Rubrivivax sp.]|nr:YidB family protein [Rubrivivax sp.]
MGLLDSVIGALGQAQGAGGIAPQPDLLQAVIAMLANGQGAGQGGLGGGMGGLAGLVQQLQQAGLGDIVGSWVSTGQNQPVAPDQLGRALGSDTVAGLARQLGMSSEDMLGPLAQLLPQVVDRLTPDGRVPQGQPEGLEGLAGMLGGLFNPR